MTDISPDIPHDLVSIKRAAEILTAHGDKVSQQGLSKYLKPRPELIEKTVGRTKLVNPARLLEERDNFSREVMRGEHLNRRDPKARSKRSSRVEEKKSTSPRLATSNPAPEPTELDAARRAKANKEEAQAQKAMRENYQSARDLISTAEFEVTLGLLITLFEETLFGVNLADDTDEILAANNLPDTARTPTKNILKTRRRALMSAMVHTITTEMERLDPDHASGFRARLSQITEQIHEARQALLNQTYDTATA